MLTDDKNDIVFNFSFCPQSVLNYDVTTECLVNPGNALHNKLSRWKQPKTFTLTDFVSWLNMPSLFIPCLTMKNKTHLDLLGSLPIKTEI